MSPYLFMMVMEVLTLLLQQRVDASNEFRYHKHCEKQRIVNVCFADDLFLFAYGNLGSAKVLMEALDDFKVVSGLIQSIPKSMAYFCNVLNHVKLSILSFMPFEEGKLHVKYLGVPLISSRLLYKDCKILVEKVQNRIGDWKNKIMRGFLWCHGEMKKGKAKVEWENICFVKSEGGLGIRRSFWDVPPKAGMSWGWRKLLQIRTIIREHIWYRIGNGNKVFVWFDKRCEECPLRSLKIVRQITNKLLWRDIHGDLKEFLVSRVWDTIRPRNVAVPWLHVVWLFMRGLDFMDDIPSSMEDIVAALIPISNKSSVKSVIARLVVAASSYYIWQERNNRIFKKKSHKVEQLRDAIITIIRLKLMSLRYKNSTNVTRCLDHWQISKYNLSYDL
ncbi:lysine histidine transporter-like 8 protein [Tanacetum coccineum]